MENKLILDVKVQAESYYLEEHSKPDENHYVYAYKIRIKNLSKQSVQLISRYWIITDSSGEINEVRGEGVVGEQPLLSPGEEFQYTSGSHLKSEMGTNIIDFRKYLIFCKT